MNLKLSKEYSIKHDFMEHLNQRYNKAVPFDYTELSKVPNLNIPVEKLQEELAINQKFIDIAINGVSELNETSRFLFESISEIPSFYLAQLFDSTDEKIAELCSHHFNTQFNDLRDLKKWLVTSSLSEYDKYRVMMLISERRHINEMVENFLEQHKDTLDRLEIAYQEHFPKFLEEFDLNMVEKFIKENNMDFSTKSDINVNLTPLVPIYIKLKAKDVVNGIEPIDMYVAPNTFRIYELGSQTENDESEFLYAAKILSEPKKFEILKLCLAQAKYGTELAKELGLTGATISHHVNQLVNCGYLSISIDSNKVYYKTEPSAILHDIQLVKNIFKK